MSEAKITKTSWIKASQRFSNEYDVLEKKVATSAFSKDKAISDEKANLRRGREERKKRAWRQIDEMKKMYIQIRKSLREFDAEPGVLTNTSLKHLEIFEEKLTAFKLLMRSDFDALVVQEKVLFKELHNFSEEVDKWESSKPDMILQQKIENEEKEKTYERHSRDIERKAVIGAIDRKITSLGKYGNWDSRDHDMFLKCWNQVMENQIQSNDFKLSDSTEQVLVSDSQQAAILRKMKTFLRGAPQNHIEDHLNWYLNYLFLNLQKKKIVREWKNESMKEQEQSQVTGEALFSEAEVESLPSKDSEIRLQEERLATKERIAQWRAAQAREHKEEEDAKIFEEDRQKEQKMQEEKKTRQEVQLQLDEWKKAGDIKRSTAENSDCKNASVPIDYDLLRRRQERDLELTRVKMEKIGHKIATEGVQARQQRAKSAAATLRVHTPAARDADRLLATTKAFESSRITYDDLNVALDKRRTASAHSKPVAFSGRDLAFAGRATPSWGSSAAFG